MCSLEWPTTTSNYGPPVDEMKSVKWQLCPQQPLSPVHTQNSNGRCTNCNNETIALHHSINSSFGFLTTSPPGPVRPIFDDEKRTHLSHHAHLPTPLATNCKGERATMPCVMDGWVRLFKGTECMFALGGEGG